MKRFTSVPVLFVAPSTLALAHHGANPIASIPLWQIVTVGVLAVVAFFLVTWVRKNLQRRHRALGRTRPRPPGS